jgi:molybdopterin converting factor small subunit
MMVRIRLFAVAKELTGSDTVTVDVAPAARLADVRQAVEEEFPALRAVLRHAVWAVDTAYADDTTAVSEHSDIALIPPVSGG